MDDKKFDNQEFIELEGYKDFVDNSNNNENNQENLGDDLKKNSANRLKYTLYGVIAFLSCLIVFLTVYVVKNDILDKNQVNLNKTESKVLDTPEIKYETKPEDERQISAESIYNLVAPSVVGVVVYDSDADIISDPIAQGSGIIIDPKGYIATNAHVIDNTKEHSVKIVLNTEEEFSGTVVGYDTRTDIAVIKCDKVDLPCATLGDSEQVKVGESVLALGNPFGLDFASSLTRGIVSAVGRSADGSPKSLVKYIQTDAAINPGNSGGALINMYGQVVGMNTLKIGATGVEGMGFAIPSNTLKEIVSDIITLGYVSGRVKLGISAKMISNYQAQLYNVPIGLVIAEISQDSNLRSAGVQTGDIITKINDVNITSFDVFYGELYDHKPGDTVKLSIYRTSSRRRSYNNHSNSFDVDITLAEDRGETQDQKNNYNNLTPEVNKKRRRIH